METPITLSSQQQEAVNSPAKNILALCGPGGGKTFCVIQRILRLVADGSHPKSIAALTYTNKAADEMVRRLGDCKIGFCGTLHSFMLNLIQSHRHVIGYKSRVTVLDEASRTALMNKILFTHRVHDSMKAIDEVLARGIPTLTRSPSKLELVAKDFYDTMVRTCTIDFESILIFGLEMLDRFPEIGINISGQKVTHLFVDEFQDCTDRDFLTIQKLPVDNRFLVGDSDQSIFGFRKGSVRHIVELAADAKWHKVMLESNYRSNSEICNSAQGLIEHNKNRVKKVTKSERGPGGHVNIVAALRNPGQERALILDLISKLQRREPSVPFTEMAVLVRTNALVQDYAGYLKNSGIPVAEKSRPEVPDDFEKAKLLVMLIDNPTNDFVAHRFLTLELGAVTANAVARKAGEEFSTVLKQSGLFTIEILPNDIVAQLELTWRHIKRFCSSESLWLFEKQAGSLLKSRGKEFDLQDLLIAVNQDAFEETVSEGVTVSTIHSAKGLEWAVVFLPAFEDEVIPGTRKDLDVEEERRLVFVAMTRAKDCLVISHCEGRTRPWTGDKIWPASPSRFLKEIH